MWTQAELALETSRKEHDDLKRELTSMKNRLDTLEKSNVIVGRSACTLELELQEKKNDKKLLIDLLRMRKQEKHEKLDEG
ncbi:unnamed protein product [Sphagnum balticum]